MVAIWAAVLLQLKACQSLCLHCTGWIFAPLPVQCEQEVRPSFGLACSSAWKAWAGEQATLSCFRIKSGPSCCSLEFTNKNPCCNFNSTKVFRLGLDCFKNLSNLIRSAFNSAAEQSCSGTKISSRTSISSVNSSSIRYTFCNVPFHYPVLCVNTILGPVDMIPG